METSKKLPSMSIAVHSKPEDALGMWAKRTSAVTVYYPNPNPTVITKPDSIVKTYADVLISKTYLTGPDLSSTTVSEMQKDVKTFKFPDNAVPTTALNAAYAQLVSNLYSDISKGSCAYIEANLGMASGPINEHFKSDAALALTLKKNGLSNKVMAISGNMDSDLTLQQETIRSGFYGNDKGSKAYFADDEGKVQTTTKNEWFKSKCTTSSLKFQQIDIGESHGKNSGQQQQVLDAVDEHVAVTGADSASEAAI